MTLFPLFDLIMTLNYFLNRSASGKEWFSFLTRWNKSSNWRNFTINHYLWVFSRKNDNFRRFHDIVRPRMMGKFLKLSLFFSQFRHYFLPKIEYGYWIQVYQLFHTDWVGFWLLSTVNFREQLSCIDLINIEFHLDTAANKYHKFWTTATWLHSAAIVAKSLGWIRYPHIKIPYTAMLNNFQTSYLVNLLNSLFESYWAWL